MGIKVNLKRQEAGRKIRAKLAELAGRIGKPCMAGCIGDKHSLFLSAHARKKWRPPSSAQGIGISVDFEIRPMDLKIGSLESTIQNQLVLKV